MRLIIFFLGIIFVIGYSLWIIFNPQGYRDYLANHPEMDPKDVWGNASDGKLRALGIGFIVAMLACGFVVLKLVGIL